MVFVDVGRVAQDCIGRVARECIGCAAKNRLCVTRKSEMELPD